MERRQKKRQKEEPKEVGRLGKLEEEMITS